MSKKSAFIFGVVAIFVLAGVLTLFWYGMQRVLPRESFFQMNVAKKESTTNATVTRVIDGDTFDVRMNETKETVRLLGIDTPETKDPRKQVQCFGREAHDKLASLIEGKVVRLVADESQGERDKYHRLLRYTYLTDGTNINAVLVQEGFAFAYREYPVRQLEAFIQLERTARSAKRGLWSACAIQTVNGHEQTNPL